MILPMVRSKVNPASRREGDATYKLFQTVQFFLQRCISYAADGSAVRQDGFACDEAAVTQGTHRSSL